MFTPTFVLQEYWRDFVNCLDLFEALLDHRLTLVRLKNLGRWQVAIICYQRIHSVTLVVVGNGLLVGDPLDIKTSLCDLAVSHIRPRAAPPCLLIQMFFAHRTAYFEVAAHVLLVEDCLDLEI